MAWCSLNLLHLMVLLCLLLAAQSDEHATGTRNITITYNDGCSMPECEGKNGTFYNLVHFRAVGVADTIHFVWSTIGAPSLLMAKTSLKAELKVDWEKVLGSEDEAISFEPAGDVQSVSGYILSRVIEYDDPDDKADISLVFPNMTLPINISGLQWSNVTFNTTENTALFESSQPVKINGSLVLKVQSLGMEGKSPDLPHLQHTPNTSEFSLSLDNMQLHFNHSRFAAEMFVVRDQRNAKKSGVSLEYVKSIDDEYTPSVFRTYRIMLDNTTKTEESSFMQWKPVVYTSPKRITDSSKPIKVYDLNSTHPLNQHYSIVRAYFGNLSEWDTGNITISFGISKDNFYNSTKYYIWSSMIGYGQAPDETISILIITLISVGLGVPVILIIFGGIFVACKRRIALSQANSETKYTSINS